MRIHKREDDGWFRDGRWITVTTVDGREHNLTYPVAVLFKLLGVSR